MSQSLAIHWFRQDLRLSDNPALSQAARHPKVLPIYILDDANAEGHSMGSASRWWLHCSLGSLNRSLKGNLTIFQGSALNVLSEITDRLPIASVHWNRCYEPWIIKRDTAIKDMLKSKGIRANSSNGSLLWEPWEVKTGDGSHYKVFTPFFRKGCLGAEPPREPIQAPTGATFTRDDGGNPAQLGGLGLLSENGWHNKLEKYWTVGEDAALRRLTQFISRGLPSYKKGRNFPAEPYVSKLSPHLHFGEISPNQAWHGIRRQGNNEHTDHFCSELGWREFSYSLLYHNPELPRKNLQRRFDAFPWIEDKPLLSAWQNGQTGVPMIDAGMRQLWQTGYMHNRVRMIVGSFLVKNLLIHWRHGEQWFWDTLVDADLANNSASWQWIAGCGADAAPYFRIFNPVLQGRQFDPDGKYIRQFVPELSDLPNTYLFSPWEAPDSILEDAKVRLGRDYPAPVVDLKQSRSRALDAFKSLKHGSI